MKILSFLFVTALMCAGCTTPPCDCKEVKTDSVSVVSTDSLKIDSVKIDTTK